MTSTTNTSATTQTTTTATLSTLSLLMEDSEVLPDIDRAVVVFSLQGGWHSQHQGTTTTTTTAASPEVAASDSVWGFPETGSLDIYIYI